MKTEEQARTRRCCGPWPCGVPDDRDGVQSVQRLCVASDCMAWDWRDGEWEFSKTRNLTDDQEMMVKRIKSHPSELGMWKRPKGEPLPPPGERWVPDGELKEAINYAAGVFVRSWKRKVHQRCGDCGLKRSKR